MKIRLRYRHYPPVAYLAGCLCTAIFSLFLAGNASAATYYIAPSGLDSNAGTSASSPWKTFGFAIPRLVAGDTLILLNGTYNTSNSGVLLVSNKNGTASQPITIKAQNERQAHINNAGNTTSLRIAGSSYIVIEGLQLSSADNAAVTNQGQAASASDSNALTFRRNLFHHNNRYCNCHLLTLQRVNNSLFEENEFYFFHRHAAVTKPGTYNTFRRNYCNSRGYGNISGGYPNGNGTQGGDMCISLYPAGNTIVENLISEGRQTAFDVQASGETDAVNNRFLGIISLGGNYGVVVKARSEGTGALFMPRNNVLKDVVVYGAAVVGMYFRGVKNQRCDNCMSLFNPNNSGLIVDVEGGSPGDGQYSFFSDNSLSVSNGGTGFLIAPNIQTWTVRNPNAHRNSPDYQPSSSSNLIGKISMDPALGPCRVFIPDGSPLKGAGLNGGDIGANVLYRYEDGALTNTPLWDLTTGRFPCGAVVAGINDVSGSSCNDVHQRLNVNTNGCAFPSSYKNGTDKVAPSAPQNLRVS